MSSGFSLVGCIFLISRDRRNHFCSWWCSNDMMIPFFWKIFSNPVRTSHPPITFPSQEKCGWYDSHVRFSISKKKRKKKKQNRFFSLLFLPSIDTCASISFSIKDVYVVVWNHSYVSISLSPLTDQRDMISFIVIFKTTLLPTHMRDTHTCIHTHIYISIVLVLTVYSIYLVR